MCTRAKEIVSFEGDERTQRGQGGVSIKLSTSLYRFMAIRCH